MTNLYEKFKGSVFLVTGGTGSFGHAFCKALLTKYEVSKLIVLSRDEMKQWEMQQLFSGDSRIRFFLGDVRDKDRLYRAFDGVDYVVHAAASKIVPLAEYNPFECIKTNIIGSMNVIDAAIDCGVKDVVALSTDKASSPINLYGATKLAADKLFVTMNESYSGTSGTRCSVVRYGNVMGSRGSVIPFFSSLPEAAPTPVTDSNMTRFMISIEQGVELVFTAFKFMVGGEIFVKKIPSMNIVDIAKTVRPNSDIEIVGLRPGEKLHEQMIGIDDAPFTYEFCDHYRIVPSVQGRFFDQMIEGGVKVPVDFEYVSDKNIQWMSSGQLKEWLTSSEGEIGET